MRRATDKMHFDYIVKKIPFLACLPSVELSELKRIIVEKRFSKNQVILYEEDTPNYLYFVYSGKVKAVQLSADGKERIIAIHKRGDFFGEMAILDGKTAPAMVVALEDTQVGFISKENFDNYLLKNSRVLLEIIAMLCARLRESWLMLKVLSFADAEQRIRIVLKIIGDQFGVKDTRGTIINLRITHKDIADLASLSRETVTRFFKRLIEAGEIDIPGNKHIILKPTFFKKTDIL